MWSLAQTIDRMTSWLPPALAAGDGFARAIDAARRLPAALTNCVFFELWPPDGAARVDLIVRLDTRGRALLADPRLRALDASLRAEPAWQRVAAFARAWAADGLLDRHVEGAWLEFDLDPAQPDPWLRPRVFVDIALGRHAPPSRDTALAVAMRAWRPLASDPMPSRLHDRLRACFACLPLGGAVRYLGFSPDQPDRGLRVCATRLGEAWPRYLATIGWPGDARDLQARVMAPIAQAVGGAAPQGAAVVHLDLTPDVAPRLGLEFAFDRSSQQRGRVDERALLDLLVSQAWCSAESRDGLLQWPGRSVELMPHDIWHSRVGRRVSHVKVTYATGKPIAMKTYLCFFFELLRGGTLVGGRPWCADSAVVLSNSAPARSLATAPQAPPPDIARPPAVARAEAAGRRFAAPSRE